MEWQTIETAPNDATVIAVESSTENNLTYGLNGKQVVIPIYIDEYGRFCDPSEWVPLIKNPSWRFTHWMPLPPPPSLAAANNNAACAADDNPAEAGSEVANA